jgi:Protein of unknown function (DUF3551)
MAFDRCCRLPVLKIAFTLAAFVGAGVLMSGSVAKADWAQTAPWCANMGGRDGGWDCGYYTFDQCMATARGLGGSCAPNPRALAAPKPPPRRARKQSGLPRHERYSSRRIEHLSLTRT